MTSKHQEGLGMTDKIAERKREFEQAVKAMLADAFLAGFMSTGEGWNGEYPFDFDEEDIKKDRHYQEKLNDFLEKKGIET